jgi:hypothetical protein
MYKVSKLFKIHLNYGRICNEVITRTYFLFLQNTTVRDIF